MCGNCKDNQVEATNRLLLDMIKNQKENSKSIFKVYITSIICLTLILICVIVGIIYYESGYELESVTETKTVTQEVSGSDSEINNVEGDMYKDNSIHNEE